jgi:hypothetical protein
MATLKRGKQIFRLGLHLRYFEVLMGEYMKSNEEEDITKIS